MTLPTSHDWSIPFVNEEKNPHLRASRLMKITLVDLTRHAIAHCPPTFTTADIKRVLAERYNFVHPFQINLAHLEQRGEIEKAFTPGAPSHYGHYRVTKLRPIYPEPKPLEKQPA